VIIPARLSYTDFLCFIQRDISTFFEQNFDKGEKLSSSVIALRVAIEIFRIISIDTAQISINTLIDYVNKVELFPLSMSQMLELFGILSKHTHEPVNINEPYGDDKLKLCAYNLQDFVHRFHAPIQTALEQIGYSFIDTYCIKQFSEKRPRVDESMFNCRSYLKKTFKEHHDCMCKHKHHEEKNDDGCDLDDDDEETSKVKMANQKKAMLSLEKIVNAVRRETTVLMTRTNTVSEELGTMTKYDVFYNKIIARRLDKTLIKNLAQRTRGFLMRKSQKYTYKWQSCFYQFDILKFASVKASKILTAFAVKDNLM
jgi:hypothetical protein